MADVSPDFESPSPEYLSSLLQGYEVRVLVSSGIGGALYEAQQISLDRKVTIKVLPPQVGKDASLRAAFEAEAKTMARLNDPNLVDVFDFGDIDGMLYIIMEHVPGRSLHEATHGSHVDLKESARLISDVCRGLHHAHQEGIVHKALEPKNILINNEAQPKIVDFGLASLFSQQSGNISNPYSAPETRVPDLEVDCRADIYSAGMILYDLVVGRLPQEPYISPSSARNCRPEIDNIVYKAIHPDPNERYSSADQMAEDLEEMLTKMGAPPTQEAIKTLVTTSSSTRPRPISRPVVIPSSSSSNSALIITLLIVAILAGIILLLVNSASSSSEANKKAEKGKAAPVADNSVPKSPAPKPKPPKRKPVRPTPPDKPHIADTPRRPIEPEPDPDSDDDDMEEDDAITPDSEPKPPVEPIPPVKPAPPEFDREAWLEKARAFMRKRARNKLLEYDKARLKNIDSFERDVKRVIRRLDRDMRKPAENEAEAVFVILRDLGYIPEDSPKDTPNLVKKIYPVALADQEEIDLKFLEDFTRLRIVYIQGIDKQTSILKKEGNDEHAEALDEEIKATQEDMDRFIRILRDQDPDPEPEEGEDDDEDKEDEKKDK